MKRWILLLLLLPAHLHAETLAQLLANVRMELLDRGTPRAFADSVYTYNARNALQYVGAKSLSVVVDTTIALIPGQIVYTLSRPPIKMLAAYRNTGGALAFVPSVPQQHIWKKDIENEQAYSMGPGSSVFITSKLSNEDELTLHYVTSPLALPGDSTTAIDLPTAGLLAALHYQTAADVLDATRIPANQATAQKYQARADELIQLFLIAVRGEPADSLALK